MNRNFSNISLNEDSTAFSNCNRSGEFPTTSLQSKRLILACATEKSDDLIQQLVSDLESDSMKTSGDELRLLAKNKPENRVKIAKSGAIKPLISLISCSDPELQEHGVTAILNLSLCYENKELLASSGAIRLLVIC
ncbi:putative armadillo-like helical protein [Helianthus annuus]|uniref:protein spotted leaf 11-like n=1 Tax=Helianthus annuus TaxID=4232 RepID=UPI000B8F62D3|nr:protein spotted leaf 11-like [Helianthus annuus]KAJ0468280.1 putative armadillo-like helical protein [Helianthus annuus]KAJ0853401.1 putative armadillo-like helical protein [Helianthus annuus]